ncbi:GTP cyclohydrolase II [Chitiniphilus purpureus]|uniref:GTP cyclohydrolase-2 n=1 Tax=Chitiniphilus purpureus TaxID=2981137 RepID=A0ABY6DLF7_9NEIS|nr:GTP cyclohydrolase II [Chitiniphilus sp. CD1]UXY15194.1 GTP cyclohydrolase II [Chitiniphilus sp. CD1]
MPVAPHTESAERFAALSAPVDPALVDKVATARLPTRHGEFVSHVYRSRLDAVEHVALVVGDVAGQEGVLVRLHSECLTGDVFGSLRCDCGEQLDLALQRIQARGQGVLLYLRGQEGRGIGLTHKIRAYALQDHGLDTVQANEALGLPVDARSYDAAAAILCDLGIRSVRLMSNNPAKVTALESAGLAVQQREAHEIPANAENHRYLAAKQQKLGHLLLLQR